MLRLSGELLEVVLADTQNQRRRIEQHIVMTADVRGLYTYLHLHITISYLKVVYTLSIL